MRKIYSLLSLLVFAFAVCGQNNETPNSNLLKHSIFFIGDLGEANIVDANLDMLREQLNQANEKATLVFLGNSISKEYAKQEVEDISIGDQNLIKLLDLAKSFKGESIFIPGEKEWNQGHKRGWEAIMNLETYIEDYIGKGDVFLPTGGCPGPVEIEIGNDVVLLVIDSQWWLHVADKPEAECGFESSSDFLIQLSDALKEIKTRKLYWRHIIQSIVEENMLVIFHL